MKKTILTALIAALAAPLAAHAENTYIGANVGRSEQKINIDGYSFSESATAYKVYGGYKLDQRFGLEVGYADLREAEKSGNGARVASKPQSLYVAVTGTLPLNEQFSVFGKLGAARTHVKLTASVPGYSESASDDRASAYASIGAAYALNANISLVAEYEYFDKIAKGDGGHIKADLLSVGVRYAF